MKAALLTNFIPPYRLSLYKELERKVEELQIFVSTEMEENRSWMVNHGDLKVKVQTNISYKKRWKNELGFVDTTDVHLPINTIFLLKHYNPDVVFSNEMGFRSLLAAMYCILYKKPLILWLALSEHTETNKGFVRTLLRKQLLKRAAVVLCNGMSCENYVRTLNQKVNTVYIPCTSDYEVVTKGKEIFNDEKIIFYSGLLVERKGIKEMTTSLLNWAKQHPNTNVKLLIAGDGPEKKEFKILEKQGNIKCELLGNVNYEEVKNLYLTSDLYLFPTLGDEWGVVVNEAFACGIPVIGSIYSQSVLELVKHDETGWQYNPSDVSSFVEVFDKAINSAPEELIKMSENCLNTISDYTPKKVAEKLRKAIDYAVLND